MFEEWKLIEWELVSASLEEDRPPNTLSSPWPLKLGKSKGRDSKRKSKQHRLFFTSFDQAMFSEKDSQMALFLRKSWEGWKEVNGVCSGSCHDASLEKVSALRLDLPEEPWNPHRVLENDFYSHASETHCSLSHQWCTLPLCFLSVPSFQSTYFWDNTAAATFRKGGAFTSPHLKYLSHGRHLHL